MSCRTPEERDGDRSLVLVRWQHDLGAEVREERVRLDYAWLPTPRAVLHHYTPRINSRARGWIEVYGPDGELLYGHPADPRKRYPEQFELLAAWQRDERARAATARGQGELLREERAEEMNATLPPEAQEVRIGDYIEVQHRGSSRQVRVVATDDDGITHSHGRSPWSAFKRRTPWGPGPEPRDLTAVPAPAAEVEISGPLTDVERQELAAYEEIVQREMDAALRFGIALGEIRGRRLYRETHKTWEDYLDDRWGLSKAYANQKIAAAAIAQELAEKGLPAPANERQVRALSGVAPEERAEVWQEAIEAAGDGKVNSRHVQEVIERRRAPEAPTEEPVEEPAEEPGLAAMAAISEEPEDSEDGADGLHAGAVLRGDEEAPDAQEAAGEFDYRGHAVGEHLWWVEPRTEHIRTGMVQALWQGQLLISPTDGGGPETVALAPERVGIGEQPAPASPFGFCENRKCEAILTDRNPLCPSCRPVGMPAPPSLTRTTAELAEDPERDDSDREFEELAEEAEQLAAAEENAAPAAAEGGIPAATATPQPEPETPAVQKEAPRVVKSAAEIAAERAASGAAGTAKSAKPGALRTAEELVAEKHKPAEPPKPAPVNFPIMPAMNERITALGIGVLPALRMGCDLTEVTREHGREAQQGLQDLKALYECCAMFGEPVSEALSILTRLATRPSRPWQKAAEAINAAEQWDLRHQAAAATEEGEASDE